MAVPKKKTSPSRRNMRRSHQALKAVNIVENQTTGENSLSHHVSPDGYYRGRQVIIKRAKTGSDENAA